MMHTTANTTRKDIISVRTAAKPILNISDDLSVERAFD
jgi:hypothetical protein